MLWSTTAHEPHSYPNTHTHILYDDYTMTLFLIWLIRTSFAWWRLDVWEIQGLSVLVNNDKHEIGPFLYCLNKRHCILLYYIVLYNHCSRRQRKEWEGAHSITSNMQPTKLHMICIRDSQRICSDKGLTLETSALNSLYSGQITLSTLLIKPNIHCTWAWQLIEAHLEMHITSKLSTIKQH